MSENTPQAVFHDPGRKRWRVVRAIGAGVAALLSAAIAIGVVSVLVNPLLPTLSLPSLGVLPQARNLRIGAATIDRRTKGDRTDTLRRPHVLRGLFTAPLAPPVFDLNVPTAEPTATHKTMLIGFYVNWDDASMLSLKEHIREFDIVVPEWLHVAGPAAAITPDDAIQEMKTLSWIRANRPGLPVMPLVNNYDQTLQKWDSVNLAKNLSSAASRRRIIVSLLNYVTSQKMAGINIDFENLPPGSRGDLVSFMQELTATFHAAHLRVSQDAPANDRAFDYRRLAAASDFLAVMLYDEHGAGSTPGPIASQGWFAKVLAQRVADIPASKLVVGLGAYGYDWAGTHPAQAVSFAQTIATAHLQHATPVLDPASLTLHYDYTDAQNVVHHVWALDAVSAYNQIAAVQPHGVAGYALWRLGSEDPTIWTAFRDRDALDRQTAKALNVFDFSHAVAYQGTGEILRVTGTPIPGTRETSLDATSGLITAETIVKWPQAYMITRWGGGASKKVALTFDDGPDPTWTPQILNVLDTNNVPATFFVIGMYANAQPDILRRELAIGDQIGNHTFTHPDISVISHDQIKWQLDAVQRLFEAELGRRSVLFRPPYGADSQPDTPAQVAPLLASDSLGYYTVGMNVDPNDWARPGVQQIVDRTIAQVESGLGHIVLLHDGGGDRSQTLAALPKIISRLRTDGYTFVTVSDLMGVPANTVMPTVPAGDRVVARADRAVFALMQWVQLGLYWLFMAGIVLGVGRILLIGTLAVIERLRDHGSARRTFDEGFRPLVSVIVPAFNEEAVIVSSVRSLLASDYADLEIVVVDDGSTDATADVVRETFAGEPRVRLVTKPNSGKAASLNAGIAAAGGSIIVGMDADTVFEPSAVRLLVRHFHDPRIAAVAGNATVGNRVNLLTKWQALEYITNQNLDRRAFDLLNCITVVPGAIGAWRRDLVISAGGFTGDTLAEDADLTFRILRAGGHIAYEDEAIARTEAPDTVGGLVKQRGRWVFGTLQTFWKHRDLLLRPSAGSLGLVAMPNVLLFQVVFQLIAPVMDLVMGLGVVGLLIQRQQSPADWSPAAFEHILFYYAAFLALDFLASAIAFAMEPHERRWSLLGWLFLQRFFYRQLLYIVAWRAVIHAVRGSLLGWNRVERKATVLSS